LYRRGAGSILGESTSSKASYAANVATRYGTVYLFLQLVPPFSMFFLMTAAASSGLWAADLEKARREQEAQIAQAPEYADEPDATV
jgi:hypothetical protein